MSGSKMKASKVCIYLIVLVLAPKLVLAASLLTTEETELIRGSCALCHDMICGLGPHSCVGGLYEGDSCDPDTQECSGYLHQQEYITANCYGQYTYGTPCSQGERHECGRTFLCRCQSLGGPDYLCRTYKTSNREWHDCNPP